MSFYMSDTFLDNGFTVLGISMTFYLLENSLNFYLVFLNMYEVGL